MNSIRLTIELPDALARDTQKPGLLSSRSIADLPSAALKRQRIDQFFEAADQLANQDIPAMSAAEIETPRAERRNRKKPKKLENGLRVTEGRLHAFESKYGTTTA